jgi:ABC-type transport system substrate-binding protein
VNNAKFWILNYLTINPLVILDKISFKFYGSKEGALAALASGEISMVDSQYYPQLEELEIPGTTYSLTRDPGVKEIAINMYHPYVGTGELCPIASTESAKHIRKAISHMVPRELIISDILDGLGAPGVTACPNTAIGFNETLEPYAYDENLARYHMAQAGYDLEYTPPSNGTTTVSGLPLFATSLTVLASLSLSVVIVIGSRKRTKRREP